VVSALRFSFPAALALACAAACSRAPAGGGAAVEPSASASNATAIADAHLPLLERIQTAPMRVRHGGTRRLQFYYATAGVDHQLAYTEHVATDGNGHFALDPVAVEAPAMTVPQSQVFELLQKQREGFFFRYRDFGVRQRDLFLANYTVQVLGQTIVVAGRECTQLEVRRRRAAPTWYLAAVDETGLVLSWSEYTTGDNRLLSRSEYLEFTLEPDLAGVDWFESPLEIEPLDPGHENTTLLGFHPHQLQVLPPGYQLLRSEMVTERGVKWLRRVYGDGVENLFVLEHGSATPKVAVAGPPTTITVRLCQVGAWTLAEAVDGADQFFVVGKVGEDDVVSCLRSAF
jgi:hypothetical protein